MCIKWDRFWRDEFVISLSARLQKCQLPSHPLWCGQTRGQENVNVKILIVEDEPKAGDYLRQGLREAGFAVDLLTSSPP